MGGGDSGPITFTVEDTRGVISSYTIPYSMTWEEFVNSEYNTVNEIGDKYFREGSGIIQYAHVYCEDTPDGADCYTEYLEIVKDEFTSVEDYVFSYEYISGEINYSII